MVHEMKEAGTAYDPTRFDHPVTIDLAGGTQYGHMDHAVFTFVDANHHTEDWTYIMPGDKPVQAHFELARTK